MNIIRKVAMAVMLCISAAAMAQSGDKLFMEGQQLQQTMTAAAQRAAINKFKAAKVAYTTADKKKMCDNQIAICYKNINSLSGRRVRTTGKAATTTTTAASTRFALSQNDVLFDGDTSGSLNIQVEAPNTEWSFSVPSGVDGTENFLRVTRSSDAKSIDIAVQANNKTIEREQVINVVYDGKTEVVKVKQEGKSVRLSTNYNQLEIGLKGGKKSIEVYTNSDSTITSNYDQCWYIESKPDWVEYSVEVNKRKGLFGELGSALKKAVTGSATEAEAADIKTTNVKLVFQGIDKKSPEYNTGRKGEIIFASQDKRFRLAITQQK